MDKLYARLNHKNFNYLTIFLCFLGDLAICRYLWKKIMSKDMFNSSYDMVMGMYKNMPEYQGLDVPTNFRDELFQMTSQIMLMMFALIIIFHAFVYFLHFKEKKIVVPYIKTTCFFGALGCFYFGYIGAFSGPIETYMILQGAFYAYIFLGFGIFTPEEKKA